MTPTTNFAGFFRAVSSRLLTVVLSFGPAIGISSPGFDGEAPPASSPDTNLSRLEHEPDGPRWTIDIDNDLLSGSTRDQDYTGGLAITLSGQRIPSILRSVDPVRDWIDRQLGVHDPEAPAASQAYALQFGVMAFTPAELRSSKPLTDDRPYASLVFMTSSRFSTKANLSVAYQSHFTLGILGTPIAEFLQKGIHKLSQSTMPGGYAHQISDGGEPTARFAVSRHALLREGLLGEKRVEISYSTEAAVGFLTELNVSLLGRWGNMSSPWWRFGADGSHYISHPRPPVTRDRSGEKRRERFVWVRGTLRARAYNALLQGQFRDSPVVHSRRELRTIIPELSLGVSTILRRRWLLSYYIRIQGREFRKGRAARSVVWAGLSLTRT